MTEAIHTVKNQYFGINAHLHSFWQGTGKWHRFHNVFIAELLIALKGQLIPLGYTAETEESLAIRRIADQPAHPRADLLIADRNWPRPQPTPSAAADATATLTVDEFVETEEDSEHPYYAIAIYERLARGETQPVAWIELLSPSNKGRSLDAYTYRSKRTELLRNGLVFVELDFLHELPPTFDRLANYTERAPAAHPYRIIVLDPRPNFHAGPVFLHEFDVDEALPTVAIPLNGNDTIAVAFDDIYQQTFERALYGYDVNYRTLPLNFQRYSPADQQRIAARMVTVLDAIQADRPLESGPLPRIKIALADALVKIEAFTAV